MTTRYLIASWSPDGKQILFAKRGGAKLQTYVMNAGGADGAAFDEQWHSR